MNIEGQTEQTDEQLYGEGSLARDLAQAWDDTTTNNTDTPEDTTDASTDTPTPGNPGPEPDGDDPGGERQPPADDPGTEGGESTAEPAESHETAPVSLPPEAREVWKDTPPAMKAAIARREADYAKGIEKYRTNAHRAEQMDNVLGQYQHYFAMTGEPVGKTVNDLLRVASNLHMAPAAQKAQIVAGLINQYSVPIDVLDGLLAGENPQPQQLDLVDQRVQQALQPYQQFMQQQEQQRQQEAQREQQRLAQEITDFASKNEFYADVAADMADFLDVAHRNGRPMTLADAYQRACAAHPTIGNIIATRKRAPTPDQQRAASTLRSNGLGGPGGQPRGSDNIADDIRNAWDNAGRL